MINWSWIVSLIIKNFGESLSNLSDKVTVQTRISLNEKGKFLWNKTKVAEIFTSVFENAVRKIAIIKDDTKFNDVPVLSTNPVGIAIQKFDTALFDYNPIVKLIRDNSALS